MSKYNSTTNPNMDLRSNQLWSQANPTGLHARSGLMNPRSSSLATSSMSFYGSLEVQSVGNSHGRAITKKTSQVIMSGPTNGFQSLEEAVGASSLSPYENRSSPTSLSSGKKVFARNAIPMRNVGLKECKFCKNNGEAPESYTSHTLRNPITNKVVCSVLRAHVCEECGATGDDAHTKNYCPQRSERKAESLSTMLKNTKLQSNGRKRF